MSSTTDRVAANGSEEFSKSLDCYIRAVTMCNSLALLVSQCSPSVFAARIALLDTLQKCWSNGHSILKLVCSCDGAIECISDVVLHELSAEFTSNLDIESADWYNNNASSESKNLQKKPWHQLDDTVISEALRQAESSLVVSSGTYTVCDMCCRRFASSKSLARHLKRVHRNEPLRQMCGSEDRLWNSHTACNHTDRRSGGKRDRESAAFVCTVCGRQFRLRKLLAAHSVTHTGARPAACRFPDCGKRFGQTSTRNYHERTHSEVRAYVCSECGRSYKHPAVFKTHVETVHGSGARPHTCRLCGKAFKLPGALRTHCRTVHSDVRPHQCPDCPKRFKFRSQLERHRLAVHRRECPWRCSVCNQTFTQPGNLRTHVRIHTREKPYVCSVCGQRFAHSGTLKGHAATHRLAGEQAEAVLRTDNSTMPAFVVNQPVMSVPGLQPDL